MIRLESVVALLLATLPALHGCGGDDAGNYEAPEGGYRKIEPADESGKLPAGTQFKPLDSRKANKPADGKAPSSAK